MTARRLLPACSACSLMRLQQRSAASSDAVLDCIAAIVGVYAQDPPKNGVMYTEDEWSMHILVLSIPPSSLHMASS